MSELKHPHNVLLINGPNLNLIGLREPEIYGATTLPMLEKNLNDLAAQRNIQLFSFQSNHEGEIVDSIHNAKNNNIQCIIINPGAYTHTSIAIRDAFLGVSIPFIEIHISNIYKRESFRHHSYLSDIADGIIIGHGIFGYTLALYQAEHLLNNNTNNNLN